MLGHATRLGLNVARLRTFRAMLGQWRRKSGVIKCGMERNGRSRSFVFAIVETERVCQGVTLCKAQDCTSAGVGFRLGTFGQNLAQ